jgi:hypothetical protein
MKLKREKKAIKLESVFGIIGAVYVLPWTLGEMEELGDRIDELKVDKSGMAEIRKLVAGRLCDEQGQPLGVEPDELKEYDAPTISDLMNQILEKCGFAKKDQIQKN